jgi:hypothetical protein
MMAQTVIILGRTMSYLLMLTAFYVDNGKMLPLCACGRYPGRESMRKVTLSLAIALLFAGSAVLTADAQTSRGANKIAADAQNFTLIEPAACRG